MRKLSKILALALVLVMAFAVMSAFSVTTSAANIPAGTKLYLAPNSNWTKDGARFAAYFFNSSTNTWANMTKVSGETNLYEVTVPSGTWTNVIFCRMSGSASANNWNNKWNQTADLVFDGTKDVYTINAGSWDKGVWSHRTHEFSEATCKAPATCKCGATTGSKLDHVFVEGVCTVCGDNDPNYCAHTSTTKVNTATCTAKGELYDLCDDCSAKLNVETSAALGHDMGFNNKCTREGCDYGTCYTVAGSGAHMNGEWQPANTANDMTYDATTGTYTKVYENVAAGTYALKCAQNHDWGVSYGGGPKPDKDGNYTYSVATAGSTVTVTLKGTTVTVTVVAPHTHSFSDPTCTEPGKCSCGDTQGEALGHDYVDGVCSRCDAFEEGWTVVDSLESLNAALVNGGNIVLNADITSSDVISITTSVVLNGNGHTLTYTGANRVIDVPNTAVDVNLTIKNLTVNTTASFCERGINYNTNGVLTLEKVAVAGTNINYAINLPGSSDNATVVITDSNITGNIALNVWGEKVAITANNSNFTSPYESEVEVCSVIQFNNDGTTAAHGASLTVNGGSIISLAETVALSVSSYDTEISISNETTVQGKQETSAIAVIYEGQTQFYTSSTLQHAFDLAANDPRAKVLLLGDVVLDAPVVVTGTVVFDLNGFTLSYESDVMGEAMITNKGELTINDSVGTGVINYNYIGANDASYGKGNYTISNGGTLTVNGGKITIANLRQHAKYPIDNNSTTGDAILVINGGHLYNYNTSAIRMFCNSTTNKNSVTINGGLIEGYCAIWVQNPGKNTVHGALTITGGEIKTTAAAYVNGTATVDQVSSAVYFTISGEGGAWSEDSFASITGGTFNENVYFAEEAPASLTIGEATFNGYVEVPHVHEWSDATCTAPQTCVCGATQGTALGHTWVYATCTTPDTCSVCGLTEGEARGHADVDPRDHECDWCGASVSDCLDENNNHNCDICGDVMSKCADADKNHFCDICGVQNSHCIDIPPYDHICDWCDAKMSEHVYDNDCDADCNYCGAVVEGKGHKDVAPADHECDVCGLCLTDCVDANNNHKCDICGDVMSKCADADKDHFCDICGVQNSHCIDIPPYDHNCDWCGEKMSEHNYVDGICDICGAADPDYVVANPYLINFSEWAEFGKETYSDGAIVKYNDIFTFIMSKNSRVDGSSKTWDDFTGTLRFSLGGSTPTGKVPNKNAIKITVDGAYTVKIWYVAGGDGRYFALLDSTGTVLSETTKETVKNGQGYAELVIPAAGTYYLGTPADNNYIFQIELVETTVAPHVHNYNAVVTAPTCTAAGYTTYTCDCGDTYTGDEVAALGHKYENCVCTGCGTVLPTLTAIDSFDFTTADGLAAALASGKLGYTGTFRNNGDSHQFAGDSSIQFVVPANSTVTIVGHSAQYGVFNVYLNGVETKMEGSLTFTVTEETKVVIAVGDNGASYSYIKSITLSEFVDRTISEDTTINFGSEGNYKDSVVDFSGIQIGDNGGNNSQVKNGSFDLILKAGTKVVIHGYPGYTSYQLNGGEEITDEYYTYLALEDMVLTVAPVSGNNYFYSIEITLHTGVTLVDAKAATCTEAGYGAHYVCDCHGALTDKGEVAALGHDIVVDNAVDATCTETGLTAGEHCTRCDHVVAQEEVPALGHDIVVDAAVGATCTETGLTAGEHCTRCDHVVAQEEVPALGHDIVVDAAVDATCTETGLTAGEHCTRCDHAVAQEEVPALGHTFVDGECACGEKDPDHVDPQPVVPQPEDKEETEEPNFFAQLWAKILAFLSSILGFFKGIFA